MAVDFLASDNPAANRAGELLANRLEQENSNTPAIADASDTVENASDLANSGVVATATSQSASFSSATANSGVIETSNVVANTARAGDDE